jgi:hypothetical protein
VWNALAPLFSGDPGVMFELYNEPSLAATPANWQLWEYGGAWLQKDGNVCQEVGVQTLIDEIRGAGASNVIIVPGLDAEATLAGMPALSDPSNPSNPQLAYGIHYPSLAVGSGQWETKFGRFSASAPVIVTEWYDSSIHDCVTDERARVAWLLDYLANKEIGVVGFAFDVPGTIVADWSYAPTTYSNFSCGVAGDGPGQLLFGEFAGLQQAADGPTQADPAWVISYSTVRRLARSAPGLAHHFFDTPRTFVTGSSAASLRSLGLPAAIPTASFESETALASAIERRKLPADTGAVLYDDQHGRQTPRAQQLRPALYYRRAAQVAHAHGLMLIAAPAPDLVRALAPKTPTADTDAEFLKLGIPGAVARSADVYDVQAQSTEANRAKYTAFVRAAGAQAATAHPDLELISGISTTFNGRAQAPAELANTVLASQSVVSGYWLSDPARAKPCASCKVPYARLVPAFLRLLSSHGV